MNLTKKDRLILVNQYLILEKLYPEDADYYARVRKVFENGYTLHYDDEFERIFEELSQEECTFVVDVLDMFDSMQQSYKRLNDKTGVEEHELKFRGFDGNNETEHMAYACFFVEDLDRFSDLEMYDFNSHMPLVDHYRQMLKEWKKSGDRNNLSNSDIRRILG